MGINVLIADQERTFADALAARLEAEDDVAVVAAMRPRAPGGCLIAGRQADVIVLDADLADGAASRLCQEAHPPRRATQRDHAESLVGA